MTKEEAAEIIEEESDRQVIAHIGHDPGCHGWYTGGSSHNDDRLTAKVEDGVIWVWDCGCTKEYAGSLDEESLRHYVTDWLDNTLRAE